MVKQVLERDLRVETEFLVKYDLNVRKITLTEEYEKAGEIHYEKLIKLVTALRKLYGAHTDSHPDSMVEN